MFKRALTLMAGLSLSSAALAHPGHETHSLVTGFVHPLGGLDHLLAMLAVGAWACQQQGRLRWQMPLAFVCALFLGGLAGMAGLSVPGIEGGIALTVLLLGLALSLALRLPNGIGLASVTGFGLLHGLAHGLELPADAQSLPYAAGFVVASVLLHWLGFHAARVLPAPLARGMKWAGMAVALAGGVLLIG